MRGLITLAVLLALGTGRGAGAEPDAAAVAYFEKQVRPCWSNTVTVAIPRRRTRRKAVSPSTAVRRF